MDQELLSGIIIGALIGFVLVIFMTKFWFGQSWQFAIDTAIWSVGFAAMMWSIAYLISLALGG